MEKTIPASLEALRIISLSTFSDETLDLFKNTPIYSYLLERRKIARYLEKHNMSDEDNLIYFHIVEEEIKKMLMIN